MDKYNELESASGWYMEKQRNNKWTNPRRNEYFPKKWLSAQTPESGKFRARWPKNDNFSLFFIHVF